MARVRPWVAMVMAEILEAEAGELDRWAHALTPPEEAQFALSLVGEVISETGGRA